MEKHLYKTFADRWYHGGQVYFYSDPHFGDLDCYIRRGLIVRTPDKTYARYNDEIGPEYTESAVGALVHELDMMQVDHINRTCHKNDTLVMLGDVGDPKYVAMLKVGNKVLIMGNHDKGETNYERVIQKEQKWDWEIKSLCDHDMKAFYAERWIRLYGIEGATRFERVVFDNRLFDEVYPGRLFISDKILLSHEPISINGVVNFHGHDHAYNDGFCFAAEHIHYTPVCFKHLVEKGFLGKTPDAHRATIDKATERARKRKERNQR